MSTGQKLDPALKTAEVGIGKQPSHSGALSFTVRHGHFGADSSDVDGTESGLVQPADVDLSHAAVGGQRHAIAGARKGGGSHPFSRFPHLGVGEAGCGWRLGPPCSASVQCTIPTAISGGCGIYPYGTSSAGFLEVRTNYPSASDTWTCNVANNDGNPRTYEVVAFCPIPPDGRPIVAPATAAALRPAAAARPANRQGSNLPGPGLLPALERPSSRCGWEVRLWPSCREFRQLSVRRFSQCILFRGDLLSRADGFVEEVGGVVDFNLRLAVELPEHPVGLVFPTEHHVLERIVDMNILAFSKDIQQHGHSPLACLRSKSTRLISQLGSRGLLIVHVFQKVADLPHRVRQIPPLRQVHIHPAGCSSGLSRGGLIQVAVS